MCALYLKLLFLNIVFLNLNVICYASTTLSDTDLKFTYLDLVDDRIIFQPIMFSNRAAYLDEEGQERTYSIFTNDEAECYPVTGYSGERCIVEVEMAKKLQSIETELERINSNYRLKVFDAYRPKVAALHLTDWAVNESNLSVVKQYHYPNIEKKQLVGNYLARRSAHSFGAAIDLSIVDVSKTKARNDGFLGIFDNRELDMGNVGYLAFDYKAHHNFNGFLSDEVIYNRSLLLDLMERHGFVKLQTEFWHYFYKRERNKTIEFNFPVRDDYSLDEQNNIIIVENPYWDVLLPK